METPEPVLQLEAYFIEALSMRGNELFDPSVHEYEGDISVEPQHLVRKGNDRMHQLVLRVAYQPRLGAEARLPYSVDVTGRGFFSFSVEDLSKQEKIELLAYNGMSILYGLLRAEVAHVTALGQSGPLLLPTVNLASALADWAKKQSQRGARADAGHQTRGEKPAKTST